MKVEKDLGKGNTDERSASVDMIGSGAPVAQPKVSFFGSPDGRNDDCQNKPEVKAPSKPTL